MNSKLCPLLFLVVWAHIQLLHKVGIGNCGSCCKSITTINSVTREKSPNVHKSCPKMISLEKLKILAHTKKLPKTVGDLGKLIVPKGFKKLPKGQKIAISGHTDHKLLNKYD